MEPPFGAAPHSREGPLLAFRSDVSHDRGSPPDSSPGSRAHPGLLPGVVLLFLAGSFLSDPGGLSGQGTPRTDEWYGVEVPGGLELPPSLGILRNEAFQASPARFPPEEADFDELGGRRIQDWLGEIVERSHGSHDAGRRMWGRVSGFPGAAATADWVARRFREAGLSEVEVQHYRADEAMWWPREWEVRLLGDPGLDGRGRDVVLHSAVPTSGSLIEDGALTAPLVYAGDSESLLDVDVAGKVAVQRRVPTSGAASQRGAVRSGARELFDRGAVAVLNYIDQPGNMQIRDFGRCGPACFNVGGGDGAFLRAVTEAAAEDDPSEELRIRLSLDAGMEDGRTAQNVVGVVPGESDEVVVVNAHMDAWYGGAGDNGDGLAVQIALARHFAGVGGAPARTLVFVASGGHHSRGLNGPRNFVRTNPELVERTVLVLNLEHVAQFSVDPESWRVEETEQEMGWGITNLAPFLVELTDRGVERYGFRLRPEYSSSVPGDLGGYAAVDAPRVQAIHAGPLYHTTGDVFESISIQGLERAARFYRFFIDEVAAAPKARIDP